MTVLARLSFWVAAEQMGEFEGFYAQTLVPLLNKHGLVEGQKPDRASVAGIFSRLFLLASPAEIVEKELALHADPAWQDASLLRYTFGLYSAPAGSGTGVEAGSGFRQGAWQSFGVLDGLPDAPINAMVEDRAGRLWFAAKSAGVCRYDGVEFLTFTEEDGAETTGNT